MVLGRGASHRRLPDSGAADLGEVCVADPEMGAVSAANRDPNDLRESAALLRNESWGDDSEYAVLADRLEVWADIAPLEAAVLDALSEADLGISDDLEAVADALAALREAQQ